MPLGKVRWGARGCPGTEHHQAPISLPHNTVFKANTSVSSLRWGAQWSLREPGGQVLCLPSESLRKSRFQHVFQTSRRVGPLRQGSEGRGGDNEPPNLRSLDLVASPWPQGGPQHITQWQIISCLCSFHLFVRAACYGSSQRASYLLQEQQSL